MKARLLSAVAALGVLSAVPGPAVGAANTTITSVIIPSPVVAVGSPLVVTGDVSFGQDTRVIATDPAGDVGAHQAATGMDLLQASITSDPTKPNDMIWTIKTTAMPPLLGGTPEVVFYWWPFKTSEELAYDARRTNLFRQINEQPFFRIRRCPATECSDVFTPAGVFDEAAAEIRATMKLSQIPGSDGEYEMGPIQSSYGTGARWVFELGDMMFPDDSSFRAAKADVRAALVVRDANAFNFTPLGVGSGATTSFSGALSTVGYNPGAYDVIVRACWGSNCAMARRPVTLT